MPIHYSDQAWILETENTAYVLGHDSAGKISHYYWGTRLPYLEDYPGKVTNDKLTIGPYIVDEFPFNGNNVFQQEEFPTCAGMKFDEPCLKLTFSDGVRDTHLRFESANVLDLDTPELQIYLRDIHYPLAVTLHYRLWESTDLIERFVTVTNQGETPVTLERTWSAQWHFPLGEQYYLNHLNGRWGNEFQLRREPLIPGVKALESRRITTSHHHNPWFAVDRGSTDEDQGDVWFGTLAWSGNWKTAAEVTDFASTRISIGLNDWDFGWQLGPGEVFTTPSSYGGYTNSGHGAASRLLHDFIRDTLLPHGKMYHKVLYNSWETTLFNVDEKSQAYFAEIAASMGVELFVMDDGWFHKRDSDYAALGDWWPDARKFPNGLNPLIQRVNELGMDFGLWIEPEMVNVDSDLYRQHPDWVIHFPTRARTEGRHQLILNLAKPEVQDYLITLLDRLLSEHNITFIKWDMNRNVSEPGWPDIPLSHQREIWVRYVQGVYRVWNTLRQKHPAVIWQSCSGGGGRADMGILQFADQIWISDNTNPTNRLTIQSGFSHAFPAITMESWVTDMGEEFLPLEFRFHVSMCGVLGIGADLRKWGEKEITEAKQYVALYKEIRPIVQYGDLYRLRSPFDSSFSGVQYMDKDKSAGVLFAFLTHRLDMVPPLILYPKGLDSDALYKIEGYPKARSGKAWMRLGLEFNLSNFGSTIRKIQRV
jgi:alpha-galactosidase